MRLTLAVLLLLATTGCLRRAGAPAEPRAQTVAAAGASFLVLSEPGDDRAVRQVKRLLPEVVERVQRWGILLRPVTLVIHPSHEALEVAVQRPGYVWLRAWAQYDRIDLQSPRTWGVLPAGDREVRELLTHELTHCLMYQLSGSPTDWSLKGIPRWFSEGLASVAAAQGYRRLGPPDLSAYYEEALPGSGDGFPGTRARAARAIPFGVGDPLVDPDPIYREQSEVVYSAAHHAMVFLMARYGEERVLAVVRRMGAGREHRFAEAFREVIGISDAEFASDFRRYLVWQGWRRD